MGALGVLVATLPAADAGAITLDDGRFVSVCRASHTSKNDPIVLPRQAGRSHLHQFFGNKSTNARTTPRKLRRRKRTTCSIGDRSAYWVPALTINGDAIEPKSLRAYYTTNGKDPRTVQAPPRGLRVIAGDGSAASPQPSWVTSWMCSQGPLTTVIVDRPDCGHGASLVLSVNFPDCWNGTGRNSPDHAGHLAYGNPPSLFATYWRCPPSHPIPIAALHLRIIYPASGAPSGVALSSGGIYSAHADFMNGWPQHRLERLVADCLRAGIRCRS